jgi:hypothetical protein
VFVIITEVGVLKPATLVKDNAYDPAGNFKELIPQVSLVIPLRRILVCTGGTVCICSNPVAGGVTTLTPAT